MFCKNCGKEIEDGVKFCPECGQQLDGEVRTKQVVIVKKEREPKSQFVAIVLCLLFGLVGFHDFYLGKNGAGVLKILILLLLGWVGFGFIIVGLWCIMDFIIILCRGFEALYTNEEYYKKYPEKKENL